MGDDGSRSTRSRRPAPSRRQVLTCLCALPAGAALAAVPPAPDAEAPPPDAGAPRSLDGIDPRNVVDAYRGRQLATLSDSELIRGVADIVSTPGKGLTSFTLHAPLELLARSGLLALVAPEDRELARMQILASGAAYQAGTTPLPSPARIGDFPDFATATSELGRVFRAGDEDGLEAVVLALARQFGTASLVQALTPALLPTLTSASHAHIGLWLLLRHGAAGDPRDGSLLRAAARKLAADPNGRLSSFSGMDIRGRKPLDKTPEQIERDILARLASPPKGGKPANYGIRGLMEAAEATGNVDRYFGDFIRHQLSDEQMDAAFRAVMRVSAHAMLQDDPEQAKFGWSHCFTLPQAACGLSSLNVDRKLALATTMVWIMAYRTILSERPLDFTYRPPPSRASLREALHSGPDQAARRFWHAAPEEITAIHRLLATEAAVRNDQHLVKYTRACFDMCGFDPGSWRLYLASAAKLCALWIAETPRKKIPDRFLDGRSTPA